MRYSPVVVPTPRHPHYEYPRIRLTSFLRTRTPLTFDLISSSSSSSPPLPFPSQGGELLPHHGGVPLTFLGPFQNLPLHRLCPAGVPRVGVIQTGVRTRGEEQNDLRRNQAIIARECFVNVFERLLRFYFPACSPITKKATAKLFYRCPRVRVTPRPPLPVSSTIMPCPFCFTPQPVGAHLRDSVGMLSTFLHVACNSDIR